MLDDPLPESLLDGLLPAEPLRGELPVDAPLPDELLSIPEEAPLDEAFPPPEASTPSALAVLSSSRPVACRPFCF